jgi:hypothetical protein
MTTIFLLSVCVIVGWVAWSLSKATTRNRHLEEITSGLSRDEAEEVFNKAMDIAIAQLADPLGSGISHSVAQEAIERAAHCLNRMNAIDGLPYGPVERMKLRHQVLMSAKRVADLSLPVTHMKP